ncbi:hypothetical protein HYT84_02890, partial [Candidatus Micrarchaeota archaeon]|nr:hypothetical protein [Candidatus Micrarchaeota archaeon]
MKRIWFGLLFGLLLLGCTVPATTSEGGTVKDVVYKKYSSPLYSIDYPEDWNLAEQPDLVGFTSKKETSNDYVLDELIIEVLDGDYKSLDDLESLEKSLMFEGDKVLKSEKITFADQPAVTLEIEGVLAPEDPVPMYYKTVMFQKDYKTYRLNYGIEKGKEEKYKPLMEKMLASFELKNP